MTLEFDCFAYWIEIESRVRKGRGSHHCSIVPAHPFPSNRVGELQLYTERLIGGTRRLACIPICETLKSVGVKGTGFIFEIIGQPQHPVLVPTVLTIKYAPKQRHTDISVGAPWNSEILEDIVSFSARQSGRQFTVLVLSILEFLPCFSLLLAQDIFTRFRGRGKSFALAKTRSEQKQKEDTSTYGVTVRAGTTPSSSPKRSASSFVCWLNANGLIDIVAKAKVVPCRLDGPSIMSPILELIRNDKPKM